MYPVLTTSKAPTETLPDQVQRGGVHPDYELDPGVKGFQKRKQIRGAVERFRDDRSKSGHAAERYIFEQKKLREQIEQNRITGEVNRKILEIVGNHLGGLVRGGSGLIDPQGFVGDNMLKVLSGSGPYGAAVIAAVAAIATAPEVVTAIIESLSNKGLPLNRDWKRLIENEVNSLLSPEDKKAFLLGHDAFISTQSARYNPGTGAYTVNSLENQDEKIISKVIGAAEKAVGVV